MDSFFKTLRKIQPFGFHQSYSLKVQFGISAAGFLDAPLDEVVDVLAFQTVLASARELALK